MPHSDNRHWMSTLLGRELTEAPRRLELSDLIESRESWDLSHLNVDLPAHISLNTTKILRPSPELTCETYIPKGHLSNDALLYLHGGGWCAGKASNERKIAMGIADHGNLFAISPNYRLAPEHPFPAALSDCVYAARWLAAGADGQLDKPVRVAIAGQSAGANLAAATVLALSDQSNEYADTGNSDISTISVEFSALVLFSGIFSFPLLLEEPGSNIGPAELWHRAYLGEDFLRQNRHPLVSPALAPSIDFFPPTFLSCGDEDSLLGQTLLFTKLLTQSNVPTSCSILEGLDHGLPYFSHISKPVAADLSRIGSWMREHILNEDETI